MLRFFPIAALLTLTMTASYSSAADKYCLYWPVYTDGTTTLYVADWIDDSDANACADAVYVYFWGNTGDPTVPETCPNCVHDIIPQPGVNKGLRNRIPSDVGLNDVVPGSWARDRGDIDIWYPRRGTITDRNQLVSVRTQSGTKIAVRLFDARLSPTQAKLASGNDRPIKIGFEVSEEPPRSPYTPTKKIHAESSLYQGTVRVGNSEYTIITKTPLFIPPVEEAK